MDIKVTLILFISCNLIYLSKCIQWTSLQKSHVRWYFNTLTISPSIRLLPNNNIQSPCTVARRKYGFTKSQTKICRKALETMPFLQEAAVKTIDTCKELFKDRRWNCSSISSAPDLTPDLQRGTREQAFVYALSAAALTYTISRACAKGALPHCNCAPAPSESPPPQGNFKWGGCADNIQWGLQYAKRFTDNYSRKSNNYYGVPKRGGSEKGNDVNVLDDKVISAIGTMNLHNNKVGRKVISESLRIQCKCHGVSGSCSIKTCWRAMPSMLEIGEELLRKFTIAREMAGIIDGLLTGKRDELIFITKSPDYCTKDLQLGSVGTIGRMCNVTSQGMDNCKKLCCGRGFKTIFEEKLERCYCKFHSCCYVKCKTCKSVIERQKCI